MFLFVVLCLVLGGYWLFRTKYLAKFSENLNIENAEFTVFISFIKRLGLTLLLVFATALLVGLIVQGLGNKASSGGIAAFVIIPLVFLLARKFWKI
jgi:hypothetical protein